MPGATDAGRELRVKVELRTDEEAAGPWRALGEQGRERLGELLGEPWAGGHRVGDAACREHPGHREGVTGPGRTAC